MQSNLRIRMERINTALMEIYIFLHFYVRNMDNPRIYNKPTCDEQGAKIVSKDADIKEKNRGVGGLPSDTSEGKALQ